MGASITVAIAAVLCAFVYRVSKWYVDNYCQDNPEIIWIWLDDDEPDSGHTIEITGGHRIESIQYGLCPSAV